MVVRAWVDGPLACIVLAIAAYCLGRLIEYDIDVTHVIMGVSMAGMLVSNLAFASTAVWKGVYAVVAAWYMVRIADGALGRHNRWHRVRHYAGHLLPSGAMLYMYVAPAAAPHGMNMPMPGTAAETHPVTLAPMFAVTLFGSAFLAAGRIPAATALTVLQGGSGGDTTCRMSSVRGTDGELPSVPRTALACDALLNLAMGVMLVIGL